MQKTTSSASKMRTRASDPVGVPVSSNAGPRHDAEVSVDLWVFSLDLEQAEETRLHAHLSAAERARAARFAFPDLRRQFVAGWGKTREIISRYTGQSACALEFHYNDCGKPFLSSHSGPAPFFNLSHSDSVAALAICWNSEIGVDLERMRPLEEDLAADFFSVSECKALAKLRQSDRMRGFFQCWTRKEAFIKAVGLGLSIPLTSFAVTLDPNEPPRLLSFDGSFTRETAWQLVHFEPMANYVGAIAVPSAAPVVVREFVERRPRHRKDSILAISRQNQPGGRFGGPRHPVRNEDLGRSTAARDPILSRINSRGVFAAEA